MLSDVLTMHHPGGNGNSSSSSSEESPYNKRLLEIIIVLTSVSEPFQRSEELALHGRKLQRGLEQDFFLQTET